MVQAATWGLGGVDNYASIVSMERVPLPGKCLKMQLHGLNIYKPLAPCQKTKAQLQAGTSPAAVLFLSLHAGMQTAACGYFYQGPTEIGSDLARMTERLRGGSDWGLTCTGTL